MVKKVFFHLSPFTFTLHLHLHLHPSPFTLHAANISKNNTGNNLSLRCKAVISISYLSGYFPLALRLTLSVIWLFNLWLYLPVNIQENCSLLWHEK